MVTDQPKMSRKPLPHAFTSANASDMAKRSAEARAANLAAKTPEAREAQLANIQRETSGYAITRARTIERMIDATTRKYNQAETAKDRQAEAMALDRLYGIWADLTGFERRGVSRGKRKARQDSGTGMLDQPDQG